jgi:hypothetical protein
MTTNQWDFASHEPGQAISSQPIGPGPSGQCETMDPIADKKETETRDPLERGPSQRQRVSITQSGKGGYTGEGRSVYLELSGDGVLVHVDVVLVDGVLDELVALGLHPRGDEGRQVQPRVPVQHQLVVDDLVRRLLGGRLLRHPVPAARPNTQQVNQIGKRRGVAG